jgi:TonB family protein
MTSSANNQFTASDIERYHSGKMSVEERHALEKAALDDPFLADALEGYAFTSEPQEDLAAIRARLEEKMNPGRPAPVFLNHKWMRVAALFIILAGAGWFAFKSFRSEKNPVALQRNKADQKNNQAETTQSSSLPDASGFTTDSGQAVTKNQTTGPQNQITPLSSSALRNNMSTSALSKSNDQAVANERDTREDSINIKPLIANAKRNHARKNTPIGVQNNASIKANDIGYLNRNAAPMNNNTKYIQTYPNQINRSMQKDSMFYNSDLVNGRVAGIKKMDTLTNFDVVLQAQPVQPEEVVVVDKSTKKKAATYPQVIVDTLEPAEGYIKFDDYIANNIKMPEEYRLKPLSGEVQLSFDVDKDGQPTNITVVKSLCDKCDEEAIRLLKEGPKWKKKKNRKGKVTIKFPPGP